MKKLLLAIVVVVSLAIVGVVSFVLYKGSTFEVSPPPETTTGQISNEVAETHISIPLELEVSKLIDQIEVSLGKGPHFSGQTGKLSVDLFVKESIPAIFEDVLITPAKAAECLTVKVAENCIKNVTQSISEDCWKKFRLDKCFRNIVVPVQYTCYKEVVNCTPEVKAVFESRLKFAAKVSDLALPHSLNLKYKGWIGNISLVAHDQKLKIKATVRADVSADIQAGLLTANQTIKGALKCSSKFNLIIDAGHEILNGGGISLTIDDLQFDTKQLCVPGAIELSNLAQLDPVRFLEKELIHQVIEKALKETLNDAIANSLGTEKLGLPEKLQNLSSIIEKPIELGSNLWLKVNPIELQITQLSGVEIDTKNLLQIGAGILARPHVTGGTVPKVEEEVVSLPLIVVEKLQSGFYLAPTGAVDLQLATEALDELVQNFVEKEAPSQPYSVGETKIYQSGKKFVISLEVINRKSDKTLGILYLSAIPKYVADSGSVVLTDVEFTADSENVILNSATWLVNSKIEKTIEESARFELTGEIADLLSKYATHTEEFAFGKLNIELGSLDARYIYISDNAIHVAAEARGSARLIVELSELNK